MVSSSLLGLPTRTNACCTNTGLLYLSRTLNFSVTLIDGEFMLDSVSFFIALSLKMCNVSDVMGKCLKFLINMAVSFESISLLNSFTVQYVNVAYFMT